MVACGELMDSAFTKSVMVIAATLSALALFASGATAASFTTMVRDCTDNSVLNGNYSAADLRNAIPRVPRDTDEYFYCSDLFRQALMNKVSKHNPGHGSTVDPKSLNQITTASQRKKATAQAKASAAEQLPANGSVAKLGGAKVERSGARTLASSAAPGIPAALVVAVAGLLLLLGGDLASRVIDLPGIKRFGRKPRRPGS